jgi:hypothetical protein
MNQPTTIDSDWFHIGDDKPVMRTFSSTLQPEGDWLTNELMQFVRYAPLDSDARANIPRIMARYERRKTFRQKLWQLIGG